MNKIVDENAIVAGRAPSSYWNVEHSNQIEGFTTDISVDAGSRIDFKINVNGGAGSDYKVEVFRLGYYGGDGAREVTEWTNTNARVQPQALFNASRGMADAGNWSVTDSWDVPDDAVSGVYLARLQRLDATGNPIAGATNQLPFIIRNDGEHHDIVLQTSDTTWQAYNGWAGNNGQVGANLYGDPSGRVDWDPIPGAGAHSQDRAYAVSYNRPFITDDGTSTASGAQDYLFGADYAAIYWLEKNGYDASYISGVDADRMGANYLKNYKAYISVGHDEYWSGGQRANVEAARDAGVNLLFWSGNECYWKTRWETATSADGTPYRTLVCYKETLAVAAANAGPSDYYNLDPTNTWTGTWRDTRFHGNPLAGGGNPQDVDPITGLNPSCHCGENLLTGQLFGPDGTGQFGGALDVPASFARLRIWRDTTVANGGKLDIAPGILGYEWDTSPDNLQRPAGLIKLSETTIPWNGILVDQGNTVVPGTATHNLSLYRAPSGALVFGAGTTFWSWGISNEHDSSPYGAQVENTDIKQFTVNMFADMGIQPGVADAVLASQGLTRASASNDTHAATTSINNLGQVAALSPVTITGTATDNDGNAATVDGRVAVVEVSLDGGNSWRVADTTNGWATWSFHWQPSAAGNYTIRARAIDDSLNVSNIVADTETVTVTAPNAYSLFNATTPANATVANDGTSIELGMRFSVDRVGTATELKYWRSSQDAADTDVRQGHLWRADGTLLATVTFTSAPGESGWQTATLSGPVGLTPGVEYVISYHTANNYVATNDFFSAAHDVSFDGLNNDSFWGPYGVIRAAQDGVGGGNGLYVYAGGAAEMPAQTYKASNYWVDLTFDPTESAGQTITGTSASNTLIGGDGADTISGLGGNDSLQGNGGADTLDGGSGTDNVNGGTGDDLIIVRGTEAQGDTMTGGTGIDTLRITGTADLTLNGTALITEVEVLDGGGRALRGTNSVANVLDLSRFTTVTNLTQVLGLSGADSLTGSSGADTLDGGVDIDTVRGGDGDDIIIIRGTEVLGDTMIGGAGMDTLRLAATADLNGTSLISEIEVLDGAGFSLRGTSSVSVLDLSGFAAVTNLASVLGLGGNDTLVGSSGRDTLNGGSGVDTVSGGAGNDTILVSGSEASTDTMDGGAGTDTLKLAGTVTLTLNGTALITGVEILDGRGLSIQGTSAANVLDLSGFSTVTGVASLLGLGGNDTLIGSAVADTLDGGVGTDSINGGGGNDTILVSGNQAQTDVMDGGVGVDTVLVNAAGSDFFVFSTSRLSGIEHIEGSGVAIRASTAADTLDFSGVSLTGVSGIFGLNGNDTLGGGTGNDTLTGGSGNDSFVIHQGVATGDDRITDFDAAGNDVIRLVGYSPSVNLAAATTFDVAQGALIDLALIGGDGSIRLAGVTALSFTTEDFVFA